ncbi:hypothetical protein EQG63_04210 [Flavobacterium amnicola]|uniref:Lipocalin-like domain-containing protein n=1 Tax=Flavobacterium amnicola TaxID=2506422 RepID=A0A4Q1K976_9FLAO|nr:hypothetical protein [Flavobacterium amnicola]RXR21149.1 hypothetical protein EQG63_04210 [Flavobacterium amnicola]
MKKLITLFSLVLILLSCNKDDNKLTNPLLGTWKTVEYRVKSSSGIWSDWQKDTQQATTTYFDNNTCLFVSQNSHLGIYVLNVATQEIKENYPTLDIPTLNYKIINLTPTLLMLEDSRYGNDYQYKQIKIN